MKKYTELNANQQKELLWNIVTAYEATQRANSLKKFNFVESCNQEQFDAERLQARICRDKIVEIKKITGGRGYYGKTADSLAAAYVLKSYEWAKEKIKGICYEN